MTSFARFHAAVGHDLDRDSPSPSPHPAAAFSACGACRGRSPRRMRRLVRTSPTRTPRLRKASTPSKLFDAIVKVSVHAVPDARSSATLGSEREGTGVVIGEHGLILTIGYLIVEADDVTVTDSHGRTLAARVVGYDHATGLGLLRTIAPFARQARRPRRLERGWPSANRVMIAGAGDDGIAFAWVVSKRAFSGNWEYALDQAIYTSPPTTNWSGAALIDRNGKLLGVGSLIVREATDDEPIVPGNMFVPIDLLKPILSDIGRGPAIARVPRGPGSAWRRTKRRDGWW